MAPIFSGEVEIIFSDPDLLVINKPAGLLSIPDGYHPELPHLRTVLEPEFGRLWIVHRLDKETSGVLLLARSLSCHKILNTQFEQRSIHKIYHAVIQGSPTWIEKEINLPLRVNGDRHHRTVVAPLTGKSAVTDVRVLKQFEAYCLVEARPRTGYTHQIRAHLSSIGFPILGDALYGAAITPAPESSRVALHALQISLNHPATGEPITFTAPYPTDFNAMLLNSK